MIIEWFANPTWSTFVWFKIGPELQVTVLYAYGFLEGQARVWEARKSGETLRGIFSSARRGWVRRGQYTMSTLRWVPMMVRFLHFELLWCVFIAMFLPHYSNCKVVVRTREHLLFTQVHFINAAQTMSEMYGLIPVLAEIRKYDQTHTHVFAFMYPIKNRVLQAQRCLVVASNSPIFKSTDSCFDFSQWESRFIRRVMFMFGARPGAIEGPGLHSPTGSTVCSKFENKFIAHLSFCARFVSNKPFSSWIWLPNAFCEATKGITISVSTQVRSKIANFQLPHYLARPFAYSLCEPKYYQFWTRFSKLYTCVPVPR